MKSLKCKETPDTDLWPRVEYLDHVMIRDHQQTKLIEVYIEF